MFFLKKGYKLTLPNEDLFIEKSGALCSFAWIKEHILQ